VSTIKVDTYLTRGGASEIAIDKLKGVTAAGSMLVVGEGGTVTTNLQQGLGKVWSNLDGTGTAAVIDSFNISGMTDNSTGDYTNSISSNLSNGNYVITIAYGNQTGDWAAQANGQLKYASTPAAGSYRLSTGNTISAALDDFDRIHSSVNGDLA